MRYLKHLWICLLLAPLGMAQVSNPGVLYQASAPSGACSPAPPIRVVDSTGTIYTCDNGTWAAAGGGGGGGSSVANEFILTGAGTQDFTTNLNSLYPMWSCITKSGAQWAPGSIASVDANTVSYTAAGATDTVCNFSAGGVLPPDFLLSVSPTSQSYTISGSGTQTTPPYTVTQSALNGYSGTTTPSCTSLASGMSCAFSPTTMTGGTTSSLTLSFPASQAAATTDFNISATDGTLTHTTPAAITVVASGPSPISPAYLMNEGTGSTFLDSVGSDNATATNISWGTSAGFPGSVPSFNGTTSKAVASTDAPNFTGSTPFTLCVWNKFTALSVYQEMLDWTSAGSTGGPALVLDSGNLLNFYLFSTTIGFIDVKSASGFATGTVYQSCATYDGSGDAAGVALYVNASPLSPTVVSDSFVGTAAAGTPLVLGSGTTTGFLNGIEADVQIFNTALTSGQISTLYSAGPQ